MVDAWVERRLGGPDDSGSGALLFFSLIAAAGFAVGWLAQAATTFL
jgi:hypothetical protein